MDLNKSHIFIYFYFLLVVNYETQAFIVPEEITSFLNVIYSNLFTFRKAFDSRIGFGFNLGDHADAQVILEFGPQKYTKPLGPPKSAYKSKLRQAYRNKLKAKILARLAKKSTSEKLQQLLDYVNADRRRNRSEMSNSIDDSGTT